MIDNVLKKMMVRNVLKGGKIASAPQDLQAECKYWAQHFARKNGAGFTITQTRRGGCKINWSENWGGYSIEGNEIGNVIVWSSGRDKAANLPREIEKLVAKVRKEARNMFSQETKDWAREVAYRYAMEHATEDAMKKHLKDHPDADPKDHTVKNDDSGRSSGKAKDGIKNLVKGIGHDLDEYSKAGETAIPDAMENIAKGKFDADEVMGTLKALKAFEKDGQTKGFSSDEKAEFKAVVEYIETIDSAQDSLFKMQKSLNAKGKVNGVSADAAMKKDIEDLAYGKGGDKKKVLKWLQDNEGKLDLSDKDKKAFDVYLK